MEIVVIIVVLLAGLIIFVKKPNPTTFGGSNLSNFYPPLPGKLTLRNDVHGAGHFGAPRGNRKHSGIDFEANPNTPVRSPIGGTTRKLQVYAKDSRWKGVSIKNDTVEVKMFYLNPLTSLPSTINRGDLVGAMQNRAAINPGMKNHLHIEVYIKGKLVDPSNFFEYTK